MEHELCKMSTDFQMDIDSSQEKSLLGLYEKFSSEISHLDDLTLVLKEKLLLIKSYPKQENPDVKENSNHPTTFEDKMEEVLLRLKKYNARLEDSCRQLDKMI